MKWVRIGLGLILAAFMVFMGAQKFTGPNPIFSYIADQSGMGFFEPGVRMLTGAAELLAAALILAGLFLGRYKSCGPMLSLLIIIGAIGFHLSPWLGINAPVAFDGAGGYVHSPMLFGMAVAFGIVSAIMVVLQRKA